MSLTSLIEAETRRARSGRGSALKTNQRLRLALSEVAEAFEKNPEAPRTVSALHRVFTAYVKGAVDPALSQFAGAVPKREQFGRFIHTEDPIALRLKRLLGD